MYETVLFTNDHTVMRSCNSHNILTVSMRNITKFYINLWVKKITLTIQTYPVTLHRDFLLNNNITSTDFQKTVMNNSKFMYHNFGFHDYILTSLLKPACGKANHCLPFLPHKMIANAADVNHTYVEISRCENVPRVWTPTDINETGRTFVYFTCPRRLFQWPNLCHK